LYGIHDSSCAQGGATAQTWVGVAFFNDPPNPSLIDGCGSIVASATAGGAYTVAGSASLIDLGGSADWSTSGSGQIMHLPHLSSFPRLGVGGKAAPDVGIYVSGSPTSGSEQIGVDVNTTFSGAKEAYGYAFGPATAPGTNIPNLYGNHVGSVANGAGGSVGNYYGYHCGSMAGAASSWCLYSESSVPSKLGGSLTVTGGVSTPSLETGTGANTDLAGQLTLSGGTATRPFARAHETPPVCVATDTSAPNAVQVTVDTATMTITGTGNDSVNYVCVGGQ
jgi:hypothetical protein